MNINLPKKDSATWRAGITAIQSFVGTCVTLASGLWLAITGVPGCPEAIFDFVKQNFIQIAALIGISSGGASFIWNYFFRKDVKNF